MDKKDDNPGSLGGGIPYPEARTYPHSFPEVYESASRISAIIAASNKIL
jgi:hypothetical protein